ncbi:MAG: hypothetical protein PVH29_14975 [Candidatus Zixiibacteriota bacterium]|jgi:hypothetical protein
MAKGLIPLFLTASIVLAAVPAGATIGSLISSFDIPASYYGYGILAQGNYIYLSGDLTYGDYLLTYTHSGSLVRSRAIDPGNSSPLYGGSRTHLGEGYIALIDGNTNYLKIFSIANGGAPVASFSTNSGRWNVFWDGEYYYLNRTSQAGVFIRRTTIGAYAGTWTCAGWPSGMTLCMGAAYAQYGNNAAGPYFVAGAGNPNQPCCMTTFPGGSLVATWSRPSPYLSHISYGDSSNPSTYGAAIWGTTSSPYEVYEIDIDARGASLIMPSSLGKIRATYR